MSGPEVATKAPESDAVEASPFPADSQAQAGASMGDHCTTDRPVSAQTSTGEMVKLKEIDVYVSKPADYPHAPSKLLLLLTGGTGVNSINNQLQADKFASEGFVVIMPDQFAGDPAPNTTTAAVEPNPSLIEKVKIRAAETAKSFMIDMWLARHTPEKVIPILRTVLDAAKDEYADAAANGGGIYAVGYCFGAKYVIILAGEHPDTVVHGHAAKDEEEGMISIRPFVKAGAIAHGTLVTREDLQALRAPISMICVENDQLFPAEILEDGRKYLESNHVEHEIHLYPEVPHGFAVLGDYEDAKIKQAQSTAFDQMLSWLKNH